MAASPKFQIPDPISKPDPEQREAILQFLTNFDATIEPKFREAETRVIVFVGRAKSGKTTTISTLLYPLTFVQPGSIFSDSGDPVISRYVTNIGEKAYTINIIDTPGLMELRSSGISRLDQDIISVITRCIQSETSEVHVIFFVFSLSGAIIPSDFECLEQFMNLFSGAEHHFCLLLTRAEHFSEDHKDQIRQEFKKHPSSILRELPLLFMGAIDSKFFELGFLNSLKNQIASIMAMRETFIEYILRTDKPFKVSDFKGWK